MSSLTSKIVRSGLGGGLLAAALAAGTVAGGTSSASASALACINHNDILLSGSKIFGLRSAYCDPPGVENPRPVTIQRRVNATTWTNVTPTGEGVVSYQCNGTTTRTYRLKEATFVQLTAACG